MSDDVLEEGTVRERRAAGVVPGETGEIEPVPGEPLQSVRQPAAMALDMDEGGFLPEGACRGEDRHGGCREFEAVGQGRDVGDNLVQFVRNDDIATAELKEHLALEVADPVFDCRRVGEPYALAVIVDPNGVLVGCYEACDRSLYGGPDDFPKVTVDGRFEATAESPDFVTG